MIGCSGSHCLSTPSSSSRPSSPSKPTDLHLLHFLQQSSILIRREKSQELGKEKDELRKRCGCCCSTAWRGVGTQEVEQTVLTVAQKPVDSCHCRQSPAAPVGRNYCQPARLTHCSHVQHDRTSIENNEGGLRQASGLASCGQL